MMYRCTHRQNGQGTVRRPCGQRVKLRKNIGDYVRRPNCPACGRDSLRIDLYQHKRNRRRTCRCPGAPWPHNRGTVPACEHAPPMD